MLMRHSLFYAGAKLVPGMMGMATTALLTRLLDPGAYGLYGLALVVMTFGSTMVFDWLGVSFLRFYERGRGDPLVISTFLQLFLMLVAGSGLLALLAWLGGLFDSERASIILAGIVMMWTFSWFELVGRIEIANFRPGRYLTMNLGRGLFIVAGAGIAAYTTHSPIWTAIGAAAGTAGGALLGGFKRWRLGPSQFDRTLARGVLAFGLPLAASMALGSLANSGTRALLEVLDSPAALGLYTAGYMVVQNTINIAAGGIAVASYQLAVRAVESGDQEAARRQLTANGTLLIAVLAPAALGMAMSAHGIATTMVGADFADAVVALTPWMAAAAFFAGLRAHYLDHAFQLGKLPSRQIGVTATAAVVAVGLSLVLIPRLGPVGAAMATTVAMAASCVHAVIAGRGVFPLPLPVAGAARVALACLAMAAVIGFIPEGGAARLVARSIAGAMTYAGAALALNVLGARDTLFEMARRAILAGRARPSRQGG